MRVGDYPTPSDVRIYIHNHLIDDAFRVEYEERSSKQPLMGYHQKYYSRVADGKIYIVGNIIIHYRFPGYLTYAIKSVLDKRETDMVADRTPQGSGQSVPVNPVQQLRTPETRMPTRSQALEMINVLRKASISERVELLTKSFDLGYFDIYSRLLDAVYLNESDRNNFIEAKIDGLQSPVEIGPDDFTGGHRGVDLSLYYGNVPTYHSPDGVYVTEVLEGVHFTGRRKVVNASTSGGDLSASGQSLLEVYPFFARSVKSIVGQTPPLFIPGAS